MPSTHAAQPHSVHRSSFITSSKPFVIGASGLPEPNLARFEASPFICFADGDAGGDGGAGAGDAGGDGGKGGDKTFTQAEVNAFLAREQRKIEERMTKAQAEASAKTQAELDDLKIKLEESGKSAAEKERLAAERARTAIEARLAETEKARVAAESLAAQHAQSLRDTRVDYELNSLLNGHKVLPEAMRFALLGFRQDSKLEFDDEGKVVGVDLGTKRYASLSEGVSEWMRANGALFVAAPAGGAGTRAGNAGGAPKSYENMSRDEIAALVNASEPAAKR